MSDDQIKQFWNRNRFDFNAEISTSSEVVHGDGTTRVYVYYDRKIYRQRFFAYRENVDEQDETKKYEIAGYTKSFSMTDTSAMTPEEGLQQHTVTLNGKEYKIRVTDFVFLVELDFLHGRDLLSQIAPVKSLIHL